jgi:hypothetical protein
MNAEIVRPGGRPAGLPLEPGSQRPAESLDEFSA